MTITLPGLIILIIIAAICGALGRAIAGEVRGGFIVSMTLCGLTLVAGLHGLLSGVTTFVLFAVRRRDASRSSPHRTRDATRRSTLWPGPLT